MRTHAVLFKIINWGRKSPLNIFSKKEEIVGVILGIVFDIIC